MLLFTHTKYFIFLLLSPETNKKIMAGILSYEPAFDRKIAENFGYVSSVQEAYKLIAEFETRSTTKFSCFKVDKDFGNFGVYLRARSIQPKFPKISVQNSMDRFGPTGKVSKKRVHLLRWTTFPGRTSWNFG